MFHTDAIALTSPSGRVSKRALHATQERIRRELFGDGLQQVPVPQPTGREADLQKAAEFRALAARGMSPRKHLRLAVALEAKWAAQ